MSKLRPVEAGQGVRGPRWALPSGERDRPRSLLKMYSEGRLSFPFEELEGNVQVEVPERQPLLVDAVGAGLLGRGLEVVEHVATLGVDRQIDDLSERRAHGHVLVSLPQH